MRTIQRIAGGIIICLLMQAVCLRAQAPPIEREFRGLWVATVDNVDWPSRRNLSTHDQKAEMIALLDHAAQLHLNVIVLQVRPDCDAIYPSRLEPWSEYLTGQMGRAPSPFYDPLAFAIDEAHKRGLELHAWFNPYRVRDRTLKTPVSSSHVSRTHPELVRTYGKFLWLDPTEPATREYSLNVIRDVLERYDIDGIHFDDYFYPYPEKNGPSGRTDFPDDASWGRYRRSGGKSSRNDWRRENVNLFVQSARDLIKREKRWVKFGISPFGIWQPHYPDTIQGFNSYDVLFCDSRKWLAEGWLDYVVPQLYWPIAQKAQSFPVLLKWWAEQNTQHRLLVPGMRVNGWKGISNDEREATDEILWARRQKGVSGEVLWHSKPLFGAYADVGNALRKGVYRQPALVPACPWESTARGQQPVLRVGWGSEVTLSWGEPSSASAWEWVVQKKLGTRWVTEILPGDQTNEVLRTSRRIPVPDKVVVTAVNRYGNLSDSATFDGSSEK
jgi:uncharacterized lipoprotein YddW (UPF0748 family)